MSRPRSDSYDGYATLAEAARPEPQAPVFVQTASYAGIPERQIINVIEEKHKKVLDIVNALEVSLKSTPHDAANLNRSRTMTLTLVGHSKNGRAAFYSGASQRLRLPVGAFLNKTAPQTIEVADGAFAAAKTPKSKLTKEERAALPKPTLAEKIAKREAALAELKAKAEKEAAAAEQPGL